MRMMCNKSLFFAFSGEGPLLLLLLLLLLKERVFFLFFGERARCDVRKEHDSTTQEARV